MRKIFIPILNLHHSLSEIVYREYSFRLTTFEIEVISMCCAVFNSFLAFFPTYENWSETFQINILNFLFLPPLFFICFQYTLTLFANLHMLLPWFDMYIFFLLLLFSVGFCRGTKNHNLIDNMNKKLEQTHKKISDVKRKCTETAKTCLQMHAENVSKGKKKWILVPLVQ